MIYALLLIMHVSVSGVGAFMSSIPFMGPRRTLQMLSHHPDYEIPTDLFKRAVLGGVPLDEQLGQLELSMAFAGLEADLLPRTEYSLNSPLFRSLSHCFPALDSATFLLADMTEGLPQAVIEGVQLSNAFYNDYTCVSVTSQALLNTVKRFNIKARIDGDHRVGLIHPMHLWSCLKHRGVAKIIQDLIDDDFFPDCDDVLFRIGTVVISLTDLKIYLMIAADAIRAVQADLLGHHEVVAQYSVEYRSEISTWNAFVESSAADDEKRREKYRKKVKKESCTV